MMIKAKRYRITLDFSARLREVARSGVDVGDDEFLAAKRFVAALLEHPDALDLLLRNQVVNETCTLDLDDLAPVAGVARMAEADILEPFVPCIPDGVLDTMARWGDEPLSPEIVDLVTEAVEVRLDAATLAEIVDER